MKTLRLAAIGCEGFASALLQLHIVGVLDHDELLGWLRLHGALLRLGEPLDDGHSLDERTFAEFAREFDLDEEERS